MKEHNVTVNPTENGNVAVSRDATTGAVTLTAAPNTGYYFTGWSAEGITLTDAEKAVSPLILFSVPGDVTITPSFNALPKVTLTQTASGTIAVTPVEATTTGVSAGTTVTLDVNPASTYSLTGWTVIIDGEQTNENSLNGLLRIHPPFTFTMPDAAVTIVPTFKTYADDPGTSVEIPSADGTYTTVWASRNVDAAGTFTANATDPGKYFQWNRNVASEPANTPATWTLDDSDRDLSWDQDNNPCPQGWRVPRSSEIDRARSFATWPSEGMLIAAGGNSVTIPRANAYQNNSIVWSSDRWWYWFSDGPSEAVGESRLHITYLYPQYWHTDYGASVHMAIRCVRTAE